MTMMYRLLLLALPCFLLPCTSQAQLIRAEAWGWYMTPEGDVEIGEILGLSARVDVDEELGIDSEIIPGGRVTFGDTLQIGGGGYQMSLSGNEQVGRQIEFLGFSFDASTDTASSLDLTLLQGFLRYRVGNEQIKAFVEGGGMFVDVAVDIRSDDVGEADASAAVVIPYGGLGVEATIQNRFSLNGSFRYMTFSWDDIEATWSEFEVGGRVHLGENFMLGGAWRNMGVEVDAPDDDLFTDLTFSGPVAYVGLQW